MQDYLSYPINTEVFFTGAEKKYELILRAGADGKYRVRKKHPVDPLLLQETAQRFHRGELTETEAMQLVGIRSRSTFYRRLRECK